MFFKLKVCDLTDKRIDLSGAQIDLSGIKYADYLSTTFDSIRTLGKGDTPCACVTFVLGFPASIKKAIRAHCAYAKNDEAYAIRLGKKMVIYAIREEGFIFAASTLLALAEEGRLCEGLIYDYPIDDTRGYRAFLPPRDKFDDFKRVVDFLAYYKYNRIILEIGGAMEYKRHPEINDKWREICKDVKAYSGRGNELQHSLGWMKNCFHCDNGGGDSLTQDEVRELVAYCRSRGLDVIPECPTFSHCDYLVASHPQIAERNVQEYPDPYPDTYCPHHPDTYRLVFDVLEEVIEVFQPTAIHIGHDEAYSVSICPKCRKTPAPQVYADDVWKLREFLHARNIHVYMWGEKLLKAYIDGWPIGGTGRKGAVPRLYPCRDLLPTDITYLHWYYSFGEDHDKVYLDRGMDVVYGNLNAINVSNFAMRRARGIHGGFVSNWGSFEEEYMQRNLQYFSLVNTAYAFWCEDFGQTDREMLVAMTVRELHRQKCRRVNAPIRITHTTTHTMKYACFYDGVFIADDKYRMGHYELTYTDGHKAQLPVKYGTHLAADSFDSYMTQSEYRETTYSTLPKKCGERFVYECVYENPHPGVAVSAITFVPDNGFKDTDVELLAVDFSGPYTEVTGSRRAGDGKADTGFILYE